MTRRRLPSPDWEVGFSSASDTVPSRFVPASVPGAVQLDWARAEGWPPYWQANEPARYAWMEDVFWLYRARLPCAQVQPDETLVLVLGGVDYAFEVRIDGVRVHAQEGMFTPVELALGTTVADGTQLEVLVYPAPKYPQAHRPRAQASRSCKPAVSYGWDWHPRLIPLGIWEDTYLEVRAAAHPVRTAVTYTLNQSLTEARALLDVVLAAPLPGGTIEWAIEDPAGEQVGSWRSSADAGEAHFEAVLAQPRLWWPNGQGEPALYASRVRVVAGDGRVLDEGAKRIGFRRVRLVMNEGAWDEPRRFPKSRSAPPLTLEVNGRGIFAKGTNWVNPEIFPGLITSETYRPLLEMAHDAHMNLLRVWGGGIINKESFFEQCDALGLMVWQEFPLACNDYADDPHYLQVLDRESRSIIRRLREHPSLVLWCGGNELFNAWSGMTDQHKALRLLNANCLALDPDTPYLATSPVMGVGHGDYRFRDEGGREVFQMFTEGQHTAYTEFGVPGPSSAEVIRSFTPEEEVWPPRPGTTWEIHHAFAAWAPAESWLFPSVIADYFGQPDSLDELVTWGQLLQAEGYLCLYEEARRQWPRASMALNWCYNEPWPAAANNSLVTWPAGAKPAYHAVARACRPALASAQIPKFAWAPGESFTAALWLLNDAPVALAPGRMIATLVVEDQTVELLTWNFPAVAANRNLAGPSLRGVLPDARGVRTFTLRVEVAERPELTSEYRLCFRKTAPDASP